MSAFTPGPWKQLPKATLNVCDQNERVIAACGGHSSNINGERIYAENQANAKLIAAAPDLLAALHEIVGYTIKPMANGSVDKINELARAAIKKATEGQCSLWHLSTTKEEGPR